LVVGTSRSGTSLLAHLLHTLGAALPSETVAPGHGNPLGHFEPRALVELNERILAVLGRSWDDPRPIEPAWFRGHAAYPLLKDVVREIERGYGAAPLVLIKDPRLCRLLPLYLMALDVLDIEAREVAASLAERDGMRTDRGELLWLRSVIEAEMESRGCGRVWVSHQDVIDDWPRAAGLIGARLGVEWPRAPEDVAAEVASFHKPRRSPAAMAFDDRVGAQTLSARTWEAIQCGLAGDERAARSRFDAIRGVIQDVDRMFMPYQAARDAEHEAALVASRTAIANMNASTSWRVTAPLRALANRVAARRGARHN
jgi:hypothetical protein